MRTENLASGLTVRYAYDRMGNQTASGSPSAVDLGQLAQAGDRLNRYDASNRMIEPRVAVANEDPRCGGAWRDEERDIRYDGLGRRVAEESYNLCANDHGITRYFWVDDHVIAKTINFFPLSADNSDSTLSDVFWPVVRRTGQWYVYGPGTDNVLAVWNGIEGVDASSSGSVQARLIEQSHLTAADIDDSGRLYVVRNFAYRWLDERHLDGAWAPETGLQIYSPSGALLGSYALPLRGSKWIRVSSAGAILTDGVTDDSAAAVAVFSNPVEAAPRCVVAPGLVRLPGQN